jgi:MFS family permease
VLGGTIYTNLRKATMADTSVLDVRQCWQHWRRWVEPWYVVYALLGITMSGAAPLLLPLAVSRVGNAADIGLVMAALSLGGLTAPLWGRLADDFRLHRFLLTGGLLVTAVALASFALVSTPMAWCSLAFLQGLGVASANTVANLFVVEVHPEDQWDGRIAWLQTFHDGGYVGGLLLAAGLSQLDLRLSLLVIASVTGLAVILGWLTTHTPPIPAMPKPIILRPARSGELVRHAPQHLYHHAGYRILWRLADALRPPLGRFLLTWFISLSGSSACFAFYPVVARDVYGIAPPLAALTFALVVSLRLGLYAPAGRWIHRFGPIRVFQGALSIRLLAFVWLFALGLSPAGWHRQLAPLAFGLIVLCWAVLSVSGTALTARLALHNEGEGMGLFNAVGSLAGVLGAALGGWMAMQWGYNAAPGLAVAGITLGLYLSLAIRPEEHAPDDLPPLDRG